MELRLRDAGDAQEPDEHRSDSDLRFSSCNLSVNSANRRLLGTILGSFGAEVTEASSVADATAALDACNPQIVITDIEMPGSDGIALLQWLRRDGRPVLPAIAVTADAANRDRILAAGFDGFDGFVAKPLDPVSLADEVSRALGGRESNG